MSRTLTRAAPQPGARAIPLPRRVTVRSAALALIAGGAAALPAAPARAEWSAPQLFATPYASASAPAAAIDGRGDAVVAWATRQRAGSTGSSATMNVAVRDAGGRLRLRRLWASGHAEVVGLTVGIDGRGRITVAWSYVDRATNAPTGAVRAAYGSAATAIFTPSRVVGKAGSGARPRLAVAPDGTVVMVWKARFGTLERDAVAWHGPGRPFGAVRRLSTSSRAPSDPNGLTSAFDARGTAYVYGSCSASIMRAPAGRRRFGNPRVLVQRTRGFGLSLSGGRFGVASWTAGSCSSDSAEDVSGPVLASVLRSGRFSSAIAITAPEGRATRTTAIALPRERALVTWRTFAPAIADSRVLMTRLVSGNTFGPATDVTNGLMPVAADAGGDLLLEPNRSAAYGDDRVVMRPAGGGADEPAPISLVPAPAAVATPGRGAALVWRLDAHDDVDAPAQRLALSVWRP